jgi:hypothetical protein
MKDDDSSRLMCWRARIAASVDTQDRPVVDT